MIHVTGPSLARAMFAADRYLKRGAVCRACKYSGNRWIITLTVKGY